MWPAGAAQWRFELCPGAAVASRRTGSRQPADIGVEAGGAAALLDRIDSGTISFRSAR